MTKLLSNVRTKSNFENKNLSFEDFKNSVKNDYRIGRISRETSLLGRKEVLTGKAKFGILAMVKKWQK